MAGLPDTRDQASGDLLRSIRSSGLTSRLIAILSTSLVKSSRGAMIAVAVLQKSRCRSVDTADTSKDPHSCGGTIRLRKGRS
jgi:hypothetical protein